MPEEQLKTMTQSAVVIEYPPLETPEPLTSRMARLTILEPLAVTGGRGAQVVACTVESEAGQKRCEVVAKIYDPLYYSFPNKIAPSVPTDVCFYADVDYSREAAAYEYLQKAGQTGDFAPEYYGSWTFAIPIQHGGMTMLRPVRLVLIEWLKGPTILSLCLTPGGVQYDKVYRLEIMARIMDGIVRQRHIQINQRDESPRNIILTPQAADKLDAELPRYPRPVLIDYNIARVMEQTNYRKYFVNHPHHKLPCNPMEYFNAGSIWNEFEAWTPIEWLTNRELRTEWLISRFVDKNSSKYAPLKHYDDCPKLTPGASNGGGMSDRDSDTDSEYISCPLCKVQQVHARTRPSCQQERDDLDGGKSDRQA